MTNKLEVLGAAHRVGLSIPETRVTNDIGVLKSFAGQTSIAKPVNGGGLCRGLAEVLESTPIRGQQAAQPAICQQRSGGPDLRVYRVGPTWLGFRVDSPSLDYRKRQDARLAPCDVPSAVQAPLSELRAKLGLDWCAVDFKLPGDGPPVFLEVNTNPMFAAFDDACDGALCSALLDYLGS